MEALRQRIQRPPNAQAQRQCLRLLETKGWPSAKHESYRYTPLLSHIESSLVAPAPSGAGATPAAPAPALDDPSAWVLRVQDEQVLDSTPCPAGLRVQQKKGLSTTAAQRLAQAQDPFGWAHALACRTSIRIDIAPDTQLKTPLVIQHQAQDPTKKHRYPHIDLHIGARAQLTCIEHYTTHQHAPYYQSSGFFVHAEENASLDHYVLQCDSAQATDIRHHFLQLAKESQCRIYTCSIGQGFQRNNLHVALTGPHSQAHLYGLQRSYGQAFVDNHTYVCHEAPQTLSKQSYRSLLHQRAKGVFSGRIYIQTGAQQTESYQSQVSLLLSDKARMHAQPQLEIYADEVRCSHGCTTRHIDPQQLFYLQSRGIPLPEAEKCLLAAFVEESLADIRLPSVLSYIQAQLGLPNAKDLLST